MAGMKHQRKVTAGFCTGHWLWNLQYIRPVQKMANQFAWKTSEPFQAKTTKNQLPIWQQHFVPVACRLSLLQRISYLWFLKLVVRRNHRFIQTYSCMYARCVYFGVIIGTVISTYFLHTIPSCILEPSGQKKTFRTNHLLQVLTHKRLAVLQSPSNPAGKVLHQLCMTTRRIEHSSHWTLASRPEGETSSAATVKNSLSKSTSPRNRTWNAGGSSDLICQEWQLKIWWPNSLTLRSTSRRCIGILFCYRITVSYIQ